MALPADGKRDARIRPRLNESAHGRAALVPTHVDALGVDLFTIALYESGQRIPADHAEIPRLLGGAGRRSASKRSLSTNAEGHDRVGLDLSPRIRPLPAYCGFARGRGVPVSAAAELFREGAELHVLEEVDPKPSNVQLGLGVNARLTEHVRNREDRIAGPLVGDLQVGEVENRTGDEKRRDHSARERNRSLHATASFPHAAGSP